LDGLVVVAVQRLFPVLLNWVELGWLGELK
jgi:hypothetical protein